MFRAGIRQFRDWKDIQGKLDVRCLVGLPDFGLSSGYRAIGLLFHFQT
jgi:hypothetical protein